MKSCRSLFTPRPLVAATLATFAAALLAGCGASDSPDEDSNTSPTDTSGQDAPATDVTETGQSGGTDLAAPDVFAEAEVSAVDASGVSGTVSFYQRGNVLEISGKLSGLAPGAHGLHIHETGDCSGSGAASAGNHFSPDGHPHGSPDSPDSGHHAGDLGNIIADDDGNADFATADTELRLGAGPNSVNGRAILVHADADDFETQPSGAAGKAVVCAVIDAVPQLDYVPE